MTILLRGSWIYKRFRSSLISEPLWRLIYSPGLKQTPPHIRISKCGNLVKVKSRHSYHEYHQQCCICAVHHQRWSTWYSYSFGFHHELVFQWIQRKGPMEKSADSREHFASRTVSRLQWWRFSWNLSSQYHEQISRPFVFDVTHLLNRSDNKRVCRVVALVWKSEKLYLCCLYGLVSSAKKNHDTPSDCVPSRSYPPEYDLIGIFEFAISCLNIEFI